METLAKAYDILYLVTLILLGIGIIFALFRAIKGPRTADRIMGINLIGTMTILAIAILSKFLEQGYLTDICLIYCMISFLAVVILSKIYITDYLRKHQKNSSREGEKSDDN